MSVAEGQAGPAADQDLQTERKWRRHCLWAIVVLLPLAAIAMNFEHIRWLFKGNDLIARDVPAGVEAPFGGSDWRLVGMRKLEGIVSAMVPDNAAAVVVDLTARVGSAKNTLKMGDTVFEQLWGTCRVGLVDDDGRSWAPTYLGIVPALKEDSEGVDTCGSQSQSMAPPETILRIRETFVVPKDAADRVRPTLGLDGEPPYYLRFERPKS
jgi:hypothetical protein